MTEVYDPWAVAVGVCLHSVECLSHGPYGLSIEWGVYDELEERPPRDN